MSTLTPRTWASRVGWFEPSMLEEQRKSGMRIVLRELSPISIRVQEASNSKLEIVVAPSEEESAADPTAGKPAAETYDKVELIGIVQRRQDCRFFMKLFEGQTERCSLTIWFDPFSSNIIVGFVSNATLTVKDMTSERSASQGQNIRHQQALGPGLWEVWDQSTALFQCAIFEREQPQKQRTDGDNDGSGQSHKRTRTNSTLTRTVTTASQAAVTPIAAHPSYLRANEALTLPPTGVDESYELTMHKEIANTSSGRVYEAYHNGYGKVVAVKTFSPISTTSRADENVAKRALNQIENVNFEYGINAGLKDQTIAQMHGWDARYLCLYMERIPGSDLSRGDWIDQQGNFRGNRGHVRRVVQDISRALAYTHGKGVVHNDVKPANILYTPARGALLCDFGQSDSPAEKLKGGTPGYIPPEWGTHGSRGFAGDVWALGVVMLYLLRQIPLPDRIPDQSNFWIAHIVHPDLVRQRIAKTVLQTWTEKLSRISRTLTDEAFGPLVRVMLTDKSDRYSAKDVFEKSKKLSNTTDDSPVQSEPQEPQSPSDRHLGDSEATTEIISETH